MEKLVISIPKILGEYPSEKKMKDFAKQFSDKQWQLLCFDKQFTRELMERNIEQSQKMAEEKLGIKNGKVVDTSS